jgi:polar amino acid transport system substrate-binding protein
MIECNAPGEYRKNWSNRRHLMVMALLLASGLGVHSGCNKPQTGQDGAVKTAETAKSVMDGVRKGGVIRAAYIVWPPVVIKDEASGKISGHFIATLNEIAQESDVKIEWQETNWDTFAAGLQANRYDIVVGGLYVTIPRAKMLGFTKPLFYLGSAAIVRKDETRFTELANLDQPGVVIACTQGTGEEVWARRQLKRAKLVALPGPDLGLPMLEVMNNRADVALNDSYTMRQFAQQHAAVKPLFLDHPFNRTAISWAIRPNDVQWKDFLNHSLEFLEVSGRIQEFEKEAGAHWTHRISDPD